MSNFLLKRSIQLVLCLLVIGSMAHVSFAQTYIYDPPGSLANVANWDLESDESMHPTNFTGNGQIFKITEATITLDANWLVSGTGSKVVVGDIIIGSTTFTIPESFAYTGTIDVTANSTLEIASATPPTMGTLATSSTVVYNKNTGAPNQVIATGSYGHLSIRNSSPIKELSSNITVNGQLTFTDTHFTVTSPSTLALNGNLVLSQTVTFESAVKTNLDITHTGTSAQIITASNTTSTIPCNNFSSTKTSGSLTLAASPATRLDIGNNFTISYAAGAVFNVNANTVTVGGTFTLGSDGNKNIPGGTYQNLTLNLSTGNGILQGNATVNGTLTLTSGSVELGNNDLTVGSISGAGSSKYIITNSGGELFLTIPEFLTTIYPIGTSGSFNRLIITNNDFSAVTISARVFSGVYNLGASGGLVDEINDLVNRTWSINSASSPVDVNLRFEWNSSDEGSTFTRPDGVKILHFSGGIWSDITSPTTPTGGASGPYTVAVNNVTSFSEFTLGDAGATLPVTWLSFTGEEVQKGVASLEWKTASELINEGFEIQKSVDGKNFEAIGFVKGAGTTNEIQTYTFADEQLRQNTYYRLRQIDFDGKFDYSKIILVESSQHIAHPFSVYPNPVNNSAEVRLTYALATSDKEQPLQLHLHDMHGRLLLTLSGSIDELNEVLNTRITHLPQGMYLLTLTDFATLTHLKVLKQ